MRRLLALYEIREDIKIHALINIMPTKGDITRGEKNIIRIKTQERNIFSNIMSKHLFNLCLT